MLKRKNTNWLAEEAIEFKRSGKLLPVTKGEQINKKVLQKEKKKGTIGPRHQKTKPSSTLIENSYYWVETLS